MTPCPCFRDPTWNVRKLQMFRLTGADCKTALHGSAARAAPQAAMEQHIAKLVSQVGLLTARQQASMYVRAWAETHGGLAAHGGLACPGAQEYVRGHEGHWQAYSVFAETMAVRRMVFEVGELLERHERGVGVVRRKELAG